MLTSCLGKVRVGEEERVKDLLVFFFCFVFFWFVFLFFVFFFVFSKQEGNIHIGKVTVVPFGFKTAVNASKTITHTLHRVPVGRGII